MTVLGPSSHRIRQWSAAVFHAASLAFLYSLVIYLRPLHDQSPSPALFTLAIPALVYLMAHLVRAVRLGVLIGNASVRQLLVLYFYCAACSTLIPFKLGELARVNEVSRWMNSYWKGILVVWIERLFDVLMLSALMVFVLSTGSSEPLGPLGSLLWLIATFVVASVFIFLILPEQLYALNLYVIRKYQGNKAINLLRVIDSLYELLHQARPMMSGRLVTLTVLTLVIWGLELQALALALPGVDWWSTASALASSLSGLIAIGQDQRHLSESQMMFDHLKIGLVGALGVPALVLYVKLRRLRKPTRSMPA
jgi:hypothetical protein